jgi:uncharacterized lipoprotein YddW (UPF0748 family)
MPTDLNAAKPLDFLTEPLTGTTLTAQEAVRLAASWWDKTGRHLMSKTSNRDAQDRVSRSKAGGVMIRVKDKGDVVIPSKVLQGFAWDELDRRERALVVRCWLGEYREVYATGASRVVQ